MRRRPLIILAAAIVIIGIAAALYFVFFAKSAQLSVTSDPFANTGSGAAPAAIPDANAGAGTEVAPRLIRISDRPVAEGVATIPKIASSTEQITDASGTPATIDTTVHETEVRFIDRASGNIYSYLARARSLTRISNKTLPGIQRASWLPDGSKAYVQFLTGTGQDEHVASYVLPDSGDGGFFLEQDLAQVNAVGSSTLFSMLSGTTGSVGSVSASDGTNTHTLFTSLLSALIVHPVRGGYFANTKPSASLDGYAFQVGASGGFARLLGPLRGLSTLPSPDGKLLLYSFNDQGTMRLAVLDTTSHVATALPVATLADKCAWSGDSLSVYCGVPITAVQNLPDAWYQGAASFADRIWKIDMTQRVATLVFDPHAIGNVSIDATALAVDQYQTYLIFTNRNDESLWSYEL